MIPAMRSPAASGRLTSIRTLRLACGRRPRLAWPAGDRIAATDLLV